MNTYVGRFEELYELGRVTCREVMNGKRAIATIDFCENKVWRVTMRGVFARPKIVGGFVFESESLVACLHAVRAYYIDAQVMRDDCAVDYIS